MLLSPYHHNPILLPKTLTSSSSPFVTFNKTLNLQNPEKPFISRINCSKTENPLTQSKTHNQNDTPSPIQRIANKLRSLGIVEQTTSKDSILNPEPETKAGEIFISLPNRIPKSRVGYSIDASWSTPENPVPVPGTGAAIVRYHMLNKVVGKQKWLAKNLKMNEKGKEKEEVVPTLAELKLPEIELRRLRTLGFGLRKKLKIGKAGITERIVNGIHERWRHAEVVKIVCEDLCRLNMKRTHDLLEV